MTIERPQRKRKPIELGKTINVAELSESTKEILEHFGLDAPHLLNQYSIALEDALIEQVQKNAKAYQLLKQLQETIVKLETNPVDEKPF